MRNHSYTGLMYKEGNNHYAIFPFLNDLRVDGKTRQDVINNSHSKVEEYVEANPQFLLRDYKGDWSGLKLHEGVVRIFRVSVSTITAPHWI